MATFDIEISDEKSTVSTQSLDFKNTLRVSLDHKRTTNVTAESSTDMRHDLVVNDLAENDFWLNTDATPRVRFAAVSDDRGAVDQRVIDRDRRRLQRSEDGGGDALGRGAGWDNAINRITRRTVRIDRSH